MRVLAAAALLAASVQVGPAEAVGGATFAGEICDAELLVDGVEDNIAEVHGGPIAAAEVETVSPRVEQVVNDNPVTVTLTCTVQSGFESEPQRHSDPDDATASDTGEGVAVLPPTFVTFSGVAYGTPYWICTSVTVTGRDGDVEQVYWDAAAGRLTLDADALCTQFAYGWIS